MWGKTQDNPQAIAVPGKQLCIHEERECRPSSRSLERRGPSLGLELLRRTFVHLPGIGAITEQALWRKGVRSWEALARLRPRREVCAVLEASGRALLNQDARFFGDHLPRDEWWRLYPYFESKAVFLDIETTGLSHYYDEVTMIGMHDGTKHRILLAGHNLDAVLDNLKLYELIVTFNGTLFDLPFLKRKFPALHLPAIHLDLRYLLRRLGYSGGLKEIEIALGIRRGVGVRDVDGQAATLLWMRFLRGDVCALERLVRYNAADVTSLKSLMRYVSRRLAAQLFGVRSDLSNDVRPQRPRRTSIRVKKNGESLILAIDGSETVVELPCSDRGAMTVNALIERMSPALRNSTVLGIDLTASDARATGLAVLRGETAETSLIRTDEDILREVSRVTPDVVSIDAPLTLPAGRCCIEDSCACRGYGILRECERILWRRGVRTFPCLLPSMQKLTQRGIRLAAVLRTRGYTVIESYPGAAQDIMRIPRKRCSMEDLRRGLLDFGIRGDFKRDGVSHDELDAVTSAIVGYFYLSGDFEALGSEREGYLIVPRPIDWATREGS